MTNNALSESDKELILQWYYKSLPDYFSAFTTLWIGFNAYYKRRFPGIRTDLDKIKLLCKDKNHISLYTDLLKNNNFKEAINNLKKELDSCPLRRMDNGKTYQISDENNMDNVFEVLYVVRNNLFHGDKKITDERDEKIVSLSYQVLKLFIKEIINRDFKI